jgi:hypothetical protein
MLVEINDILIPHIWTQVIAEYWDQKVPSGYPQSSSEFSNKFEPEIKAAITAMVDSIGTEDSVITEEMIPEHTTVSGYLGTYDVQGTPDELTLLSPEALPSTASDAIVLHYNEDDDIWEKVEDTQIIDGYVWGTLSSFSPVAVFVVKKAPFFLESCDVLNSATLVANGCAIKVYKEDGKIIATDGGSFNLEIPAGTMILGGNIDNTPIDSASITLINLEETDKIKAVGGSYLPKDSTESVKIQKVQLNIINSVCKSTISGCGPFCKVVDLTVSIKDSIITNFGVGESFDGVGKKDCNTMKNIGFGSNAYVKNAKVTVDNSIITGILFGGGNSGYLYVDNTELTITDSKIGYLLSDGSNGLTNNSTIYAEDCEINYFQTVNRGLINNADATFKNCEIDHLFPYGDSTDKTVDGTVTGKVTIDITNGDVVLYPGTQGKVVVTAETDTCVEYIKVGRGTKISYEENADKVYASKLRFK